MIFRGMRFPEPNVLNVDDGTILCSAEMGFKVL